MFDRPKVESVRETTHLIGRVRDMAVCYSSSEFKTLQREIAFHTIFWRNTESAYKVLLQIFIILPICEIGIEEIGKMKKTSTSLFYNVIWLSDVRVETL